MLDLDAPLQLRCGLTLKSRIALAPLTNTQSHRDGTLSADEHRWLVRRARGGFGMVSTCATFVSHEGQAWVGQLGIASDVHVSGLTRLATGLHEAGAAAIVQLHHGGIQAKQAPVRLSTVDGDGVRGATEADIDRVIGDFVAAARRAEVAGFDGVELHGANGYLFTQFLAPLDNPRTDAWGGCLENRARFLRLVMRAVRGAVSPGFAVGVRLSPVDTWTRRGLVLDDGVQVAAWMAEDGADWVHLSLGDAAGAPPHESTDTPVARAVRDAVPADVPVLAAGGIKTRADAARAVAAGVDAVVVGKAGIVHPDWPRDSAVEGFAYHTPPWEPDHLAALDVGSAFVDYLSNFSGLVVGGRAGRGG